MALVMSRAIRRGLVLGLLSLGICRARAFNEYQVKAAFLYTLARFVEWPPQSFSSPSAALAICILGNDPFGSFLDDTVRGKTVGGRPLAVYRFANLPAANECRILFIAASERLRMSALLVPLGATGVLTVGDTAEFTAAGGIIGLLLEGDQISLQVNLAAAEKAKLQISSRVLSLAALVK
jgi:hypothetical protein